MLLAMVIKMHGKCMVTIGSANERFLAVETRQLTVVAIFLESLAL
jgi:hypothetical protein